MRQYTRSVLLVLFSAMMPAGCMVKSIYYSPEDTPVYPEQVSADTVVQIRKVGDIRRMGDTVFFQGETWERGKFDKPVARIVEDALQQELQRAGFVVEEGKGSATRPDLFLEASVLDCGAFFVPGPPFTSNSVRLVVKVKFRWFQADTGELLEENVRTAVDEVNLGFNELSVLDGGAIKYYGDELINKLLPKVISQEINTNNYLNAMVFYASDEDSELLDKMSLALLKDFESNPATAEKQGNWIAFVGFYETESKNDVHYSNILSSFMKHWKPPRYNFYSRTHLEKILKELSLQRSDLFDSAAIIELGRLQAVDYIITGSKVRRLDLTHIEIQLIRVKDAEVVATVSRGFPNKRR